MYMRGRHCSSHFVEYPLVVRVDLPRGQVEAELEGDQDGELGGEQIAAVHAEHALDFLPMEKCNKSFLTT